MFKKFNLNTLQTRLFLTYILIGFTPMFFALYNSINTTERFLVTERKTRFMQEANIMANTISQEKYLSYSNTILLDYAVLKRSASNQYRILVINNDAMVVSDSSKLADGKIYILPEVVKALSNEDNVTYKTSEHSVYAAATIFDDETSDILGAVLIVASAIDIDELFIEIRNNAYFYIIILSIIIIFFISLISKWFLSPFSKIMLVIEKMSRGQFNYRIDMKNRGELKEIAQAFNNMADKLEKVEQSRDEFVSNVSHELKTPLSAIKVLSDSLLLEEEVPNEMYREFLQDIVSEIDRLTIIVTDLLTLVKLDQSDIVLNIEKVNVTELINDLIKILNPLASKKNIQLNYNFNYDDDDIVAELDKIKISLALSNLIENAIKYTVNDGEVKISSEISENIVYITIEDTGIGISDKDLKNIFTRFYRVDKTRDRETGGTGLGLSIVYSTVVLHNGDIKVTSELGEGSKFIVSLPINYGGKKNE